MERELPSKADFLERIVRIAGDAAIAHYHPRGVQHAFKESGPEQAFSIADQVANDLLVQEVRARFPHDAVISEEESSVIAGTTEYRWIFDPIDGSRNFVNGIPFWGVFGALLHGERLVASSVYCPPLQLMYTAQQGQGARLNGAPISCNATAKVEGALGVIIVGGHGVYVDEFRSAAAKVLELTSWIQNMGSLAAVGYLASGGLDFFFANCCSDHDYAAPALLAEEAGAIVTDSHGRPWSLGRKDIVIAPPELHPHILNLIREGNDG
jgi:myo-inositol-1(or 4)-monophosphatase